jgi:transmembrane sensor
MEPEQQIGLILFKIHCAEEISADETDAVADWTNQSTSNMRCYQELLDEDHLFQEVQAMLRIDEESSWNMISEELKQQKRTNNRKITRLLTYMAAATMIIIISATVYLSFYKSHNKMSGNITSTPIMEPPMSGRRVLLTLSDGKVVELDSIEPGIVPEKGNIKVVKTKDQRLVYSPEGINKGEYYFNTLTTSRAMQYSVVLPDGSKVWLSAATSLRYPSTFYGKERLVELTGEAYFEIANSPQFPFKVIVPSWQHDGAPTEVEVLGTAFDIRAYHDEMKLQTTVLDGSVKVSEGSKTPVVLDPGERITLNGSIDQPKINRPFPNDVIWWKEDGHIPINGDIRTIMQQLSKWYDFDVFYKEPVPKILMTGVMPKSGDFSVIMKMLGRLRIHYTLEGKKLTILP